MNNYSRIILANKKLFYYIECLRMNSFVYDMVNNRFPKNNLNRNFEIFLTKFFLKIYRTGLHRKENDSTHSVVEQCKRVKLDIRYSSDIKKFCFKVSRRIEKNSVTILE